MKFSLGEGLRQLFRRRSGKLQGRNLWRRLTFAAEAFLWCYFAGVFLVGAAAFVWYAWVPIREVVEPPAVSPVSRSAYTRVLERLQERARAKDAAATLAVPDPFFPTGNGVVQ